MPARPRRRTGGVIRGKESRSPRPRGKVRVRLSVVHLSFYLYICFLLAEAMVAEQR
jgi:hypothetical protein